MANGLVVYCLPAPGQKLTPVSIADPAKATPLENIIRIEFTTQVDGRDALFALDTVSAGSSLAPPKGDDPLKVSLTLVVPGLRSQIPDGEISVARPMFASGTWSLSWTPGDLLIQGASLAANLKSGTFPFPLDSLSISTFGTAHGTALGIYESADALGLFLEATPALTNAGIEFAVRIVADSPSGATSYLFMWGMTCTVGTSNHDTTSVVLAAMGPWPRPFLVVGNLGSGNQTVFRVIQSVEHAMAGSLLLPANRAPSHPSKPVPPPYLVELVNLRAGTAANGNQQLIDSLKVVPVSTADGKTSHANLFAAPNLQLADASPGGVSRAINGFMQVPLDRALLTARGGHGLSFVPRITAVDPAEEVVPSASLRYALHVQVNITESPENLPYLSVAPGEFTSIDLNGPCELDFVAVRTLEDNHARAKGTVSRWDRAPPWATSRDTHCAFPQWTFQLGLQDIAWLPASDSPGIDVSVRIGSLDLQLDLTPAALTDGKCAVKSGGVFVLATNGTCSHSDASRRDSPPQLSYSLTGLPLSDMRPGATDPVPDARYSPSETPADFRGLFSTDASASRQPILVVSPVQNRTTGLTLNVDETIRPHLSRSLDLHIKRIIQAEAGDSRTVTVFDTQPFTIGRVTFNPLMDTDDNVDEIAHWQESELAGSAWSIIAPPNGFELCMPTQAVGEETEKGGVFALNDGAPLEYRLGSLAHFTLDANYFQQRYAEPGWNLRRVLGYAGERAPGAGINELRVELLYGMTTRIAPETLPVQLRFSEIFSRLGASVGLISEDTGTPWLRTTSIPFNVTHILKSKQDAWAKDIALQTNRLGVFEVWAEGALQASGAQVDSSPVSPQFHLEQGVSHYLRTNADMAYPIPPVRRQTQTASSPWLFPPHGTKGQEDVGLRGGAVWGFESDLIYQEVLRDRNSSSGLIERLYVSALGGWGYQRAAFAKDKTKLYSDTSMGRVSYYAVERIGRIGVFWNRAKHVIVYERSVLPSRQFAPDQPRHEGLPILRKVEEYIQLLQPERTFPESGASTLPRGCIEAFEAVTTIIPVDSANWGRDLADGSEIPLWNPDADPVIYPRPTLRVRLAGDKASTDSVLQTIEEPQRLVFYTSTRADDDANTDAWPPVVGVDYTNAAPPAPDSATSISTDDPDGMIADAAIDLPGYWRFTFPLESTGGRANLVDGRAPALMAAALESVTMTRSMGSAGKNGGDANAQTLLAYTRELAAHRQAMVDTVTRIVRSGVAQTLGFSDIQTRALTAVSLLGKEEVRVAKCIGSASAQVNLSTLGAATKSSLHDVVAKTVASTLDGLRDQIAQAIADCIQPLLDLLSKLDPNSPATEVKPIIDLQRPRRQRYLVAYTQSRDALVKDPSDQWANIQATVNVACTDAAAAIDAFNVPFTQTVLDPVPWQAAVAACTTLISGSVATTLSNLPANPAWILGDAVAALGGSLSAVQQAPTSACVGITTELTSAAPALANLKALVATARAAVQNASTTANALVAKVAGDLSDLLHAIGSVSLPPPGPAVTFETVGTVLLAAIDAVGSVPADTAQVALVTLQTLSAQYTDPVNGVAGLHDRLETALLDQIDTLLATQNGLFAPIQDVGDWLSALQSADIGTQIATWLSSSATLGNAQLQDLKQQFGDAPAALADFSDRAEAIWQSQGLLTTVRDASSTLSMLRAAGEATTLPEMTFNRERVAYFFDDYAAIIRTSPTAALVNRCGDTLTSFGIRIPTQSLLDRVLPDSLQNFDLSTIFPDFAGLKSFGLFDGTMLPSLANDGVKITHGVDKAHQLVWLKADVEVEIPDDTEIFSIGPLDVTLEGAVFTAHASLTTMANGQVSHQSDASITGDWILAFGGQDLVTFADTTLSYDQSGSLNFAVKPENIELAPALQMIGDVISSFDGPGDDMPIEIVWDGGIPVGVRTYLDLPLPPLGEVAVFVTGLSLSAVFELLWGGDFTIGVGFDLGRKTNPFTLMIDFLGGGGYIESIASYVPRTGKITTTVSIGITAGAGVEFNIGVANGSVRFLLGVFVEYVSDGPGSGLSIGVMILVTGQVVLFGMVSVGLVLLLELVYSEDGTLKGTGLLEITVELSVFTKLSVRQQVSQVFQQGSGTNGASAAQKRMKRYE